MTDREKLYLAQVIREVVEPIIVELGAAICDEVEQINLKFTETLAQLFTQRAGSLIDEVMSAAKQKRERIVIETRSQQERELAAAEEAKRKKRDRLGFSKKVQPHTGETHG